MNNSGSERQNMNIPVSSATSFGTMRAIALLLCLLCLFPGADVSAQTANPLATLIFETARPDAVADSRDVGTANAAGVSVAADEDDKAGSVDSYLAAISNAIENNGLYSQELSEHYEALGVLYFQQGEYESAIEAFEDAMHIQKVNKGLFNLDQSKLVEYLIRTHIARGDFVEVDNHKHYLYYLQDKNLAPDDPRLVSAKLDWADWNVEAYIKGYRDSYSYPVNLTDSIDAARNIENRMTLNIPLVNRDLVDSGSGGEQVQSVSFSMRMPMLNQNSVVTNAAITDYNLRSIPLALSNDIVINQRLYEAEEIYETLLEQLDDDSPESLREKEALQLKLANISYLLKKELDQYENIRDQGSIAFNRVNQEYTSDAGMITNRRYIQTKNAFEKMTAEIAESPSTTPEEKAHAFIALGDLHLSFERPQRAFSAYDQALDILAANGYSHEDAQALLSPSPLVAVPAFGIHNFSREFFSIPAQVEIPYKGYIDVTVDKDRFGNLSGVNVMAASENTPQQVRSALVEYLRNQRFRPTFAGMESVDEQDIQLRYFYYY